MNITEFRLQIEPERTMTQVRTRDHGQEEDHNVIFKRLGIKVRCSDRLGSHTHEVWRIIEDNDLKSDFDAIFDEAKAELLAEMRETEAEHLNKVCGRELAVVGPPGRYAGP